MEQITVRLREDTIEELDEEAEVDGTSRSDLIREAVESRNDGAEEAERLRQEVDELRTTVDRLRNEKRALIHDRDERQELIEYVELEKTIQEQRLEASALERARWWLFGRTD